MVKVHCRTKVDRVEHSTWFQLTAEGERATRSLDCPNNMRQMEARLEVRRNFFSNRVIDSWGIRYKAEWRMWKQWADSCMDTKPTKSRTSTSHIKEYERWRWDGEVKMDTFEHCYGSGMFIPDPNVFHPGSDFFHPGSASNNLSSLTQKIGYNSRKYDPGCSSRIRTCFLPIPDPGSRDQNASGSRIQIRNTAFERGPNSEEDNWTKTLPGRSPRGHWK